MVIWEMISKSGKSTQVEVYVLKSLKPPLHSSDDAFQLHGSAARLALFGFPLARVVNSVCYFLVDFPSELS